MFEVVWVPEPWEAKKYHFSKKKMFLPVFGLFWPPTAPGPKQNYKNCNFSGFLDPEPSNFIEIQPCLGFWGVGGRKPCILRGFWGMVGGGLTLW